VALQFRVINDYFWSLINPSNLNNMYVYTSAGVIGDPISLLFGVLFLVAMIVFAVWQPLGKPFCAFAVAWILVMMLPVSNIIPIAIQRADRYMYYPSIVIFMLVAMAVLLLWERFRNINQRYIMVGVGLGYVAILCFITFQRVGVWRDTQTLWEDHLTDYQNGESATGLLNLSVGYYTDNQLQDAFVTLTKLLQYYPDNYKGNRLLGLTYLRSQQYANAIVTLDRAHKLGGAQSDIGDELGVAYFQEGLRQFEGGEYANALALYSKALEYVPQDRVPVILNNVGYTLQKAGQLDRAVEAFQAALQLDPNYALAYVNLGETYLFQENYAASRDAYQQAVTLGITLDAQGQSNLCLAKGEVQDDVNATVAVCQAALQADPDNAVYLGRTAHVLLLYGQNEAAQQIAERSIQVQPTSLGYRTLGDALARRGETQRAIDAYRQALLLDPNNPKAQAGLTAMGATP
jgi:tetratricopeptide (TPR) repeat protein